MFKKATSRQLLSVSGLFILVWQTALGQEFWKGNTYLPEPLPVRKIEKNKDTGILGKKDGRVLVFDVRSGNLRSPELTPKLTPAPLADETQSWPTSFQSFIPPSKVFSNLNKLEDLSLAPWRMQVKLFVTGAKGQRFSCTGTLIEPEYVLTACHCIYSINKGGWAQEVEVVPAYSRGEAPYGTAKMEEALVWDDWVEDRNYKGDMAVLKLDRPLGAVTGWLGYGFRTDDTFFKKQTFNNPGYPASGPYNGQELYNWKGSFDYLFGRELAYHKNQAYAGQSGSGAFFQEGEGSPVVVSVLSHGTPQPDPFTGHVRLTKEKFSAIQTYMADAKTAQLDIQPLFLRAEQSFYSTDQAFDQCSFVLYNSSKEALRQPMDVALLLLDKKGNALELGRTTLESVNLEGGKSRLVELDSLDWEWPEQMESGTYALAVKILLEDADQSNNLSPEPEQFFITVETVEPSNYLTVNPSELKFTAQGGEQSLQLETPVGQSWEIQKVADWVELEPSSGTGNAQIRVRVSANSEAAQRASVLLVMAGKEEKEVQVIQESDLAIDEIDLTPGWNLISLDVEPADNEVRAIMSGLKPDNLLQVNGIKGGTYQYFRPHNPDEANSLHTFQPGAAYWVQVKQVDKLIVRGHRLPEDYPVHLQAGRNLVAYIPQQPQQPQAFFEEAINKGYLKYIIAFKNGKSLRFNPANPSGSSLQWLENGMGYWVEMSSAADALQLARRNPLAIEMPQKHPAFKAEEFNMDIQHFPVENTFYIGINNQQKGTLLLMISDINGRLLKEQRLSLRQWEGALFPLTYEGLLSPYLIVSVFFNQQHINSRVYLND